jgi:poly-gamma-glutamate capsule biosynthesis protein CapA/YwtB (metallophosphatase superfamily)
MIRILLSTIFEKLCLPGVLALVLLLTMLFTACTPDDFGGIPTVSQITLSPESTNSVHPSPTAVFTRTPRPTLVPSATILPSPTPVPEITLLFTGQIVPGRCVQAGVDQRGEADYIYTAVRDLIQSADLAVGTVNGTIGETSPLTGCVVTFVLAGRSIHADAMATAGFDAVSVATNHIKNCYLSNCGDQAFFETLENLRRVGIIPIGAGANLAEALQPVVFEIQGVRFGIVSLGEIEPLAFAGEDSPGIAVLTEANLVSAIASVREKADVVIVMPHWGPEYSANPNWNQQTYASLAVEAGADLVVGNHTHVVQAVQELNGVPVFYGLGNFVFDQTWSTETKQSVILVVRYRGAELVSYELVPVISAMDGELRLADPTEAAVILERIATASQRLP